MEQHSGLDELAPLGVADAVEVTPEGGVQRIKIDCTVGMGLNQCTIPDLAGGSCDDNASILRGVYAFGSPLRFFFAQRPTQTAQTNANNAVWPINLEANPPTTQPAPGTATARSTSPTRRAARAARKERK